MAQRPFSHPLYGSSLHNLWHLIKSNGWVSRKHSAQLLTAFISGLARLPFSITEKLLHSRKLSKMEMPAPIFIIGHWRSGTTHLCNLLSQAPEFGFVSPVASGIPYDLLTMGNWFRPWLEKSIPPDRLIDRVPVHPDSPQEDEFGLANMVTTSFLHGLYFPKNLKENFQKGMLTDTWTNQELDDWQQSLSLYLKKVYIDQGGKQLLIKNPGHTTKIPILRKLFPGAKFIHIYRNPYRVFPSMINYFQKLLPVLALQDYNRAEIEQLIIDMYPRIMKKVIKDLSDLPKEDYLEVRFEALEEDPIASMHQIYHTLGLTGFEKAQPFIQAYVKGISGYQKNQYPQDPIESALVREHWGQFITHYSY